MKTKILGALLSVVMLILLGTNFYFYNKLRNCSDSNEVEIELKANRILELESSYEKLNSLYLDTQEEINQYMELINEKSQVEEAMIVEIEDLTKYIEEKDHEVIVLKNNFLAQNENTKSILNIYSQLDEYLIANSKVIHLGQEEKDLLYVLGEPNSVNIEVNDGTGIWYLEGLYEKILHFNDISVLMRGDFEGRNYRVVFISSTSSNLKTLRGIGVNSSEDDLLNVYPELKRDEKIENGTYSVYATEESTKIYFEIKDGSVVKLIIEPNYM